LIVRYIGHATVLVELDGVRLLTDPLLRDRVAHLRRAVPVERQVPQVELVLVSHGHRDHLDFPSLRMLEGPRVVAPRRLALGMGEFDTVGVDEGAELEFGPLTIRATHAEHDGGRPPFKTGGTALGYAILGSRRVFFAADTELFEGMTGLVEDLDLALVPIWGWGASLGRGKHLDPDTAAEAVRRLAPKVAVPIHWGTYRPFHRRASATFLTQPAEAFAQAAARVAPDVDVRVLRPGETLEL
jgi:L-ascorbate metabolism protein UlaG (beta-lactamase superfamily)